MNVRRITFEELMESSNNITLEALIMNNENIKTVIPECIKHKFYEVDAYYSNQHNQKEYNKSSCIAAEINFSGFGGKEMAATASP